MAKITKLPDGTMERIPQFIKEAVERHKKQYPIDIKDVVRLGRELFDGSKTQDIFLVHKSEQQAVDTAKMIISNLGVDVKYDYNLDSNLYSNLSSNLSSNLHSNLDSNLRSNLDSNLSSNLSSNLDSNLYSNLSSNLDSNLRSNLSSNINFNLHSNLDSNLHSNLDSNLRSNLDSNLSSNLDSNLRSNLSSNINFNLDSNNISYTYFTNYWRWYYAEFYEFCADFVPTDKKLLDKQQEYLNAFPFFFCIQIGEYRLFFVYECPTIRTTDDFTIHNDQGMAIEWNDGTGYYYLDGVKLEKNLYDKIISKEMTLSEIMKIEISDQRTVALKYNPEAIIKEKAVLVDKDDRNNELYLVENSEINKLTEFPKMYFLKMLCPTGRVFIEGVNPEIVKELGEDANALQAYALGLTKSEYYQLELES
jgi:hypothetical protein